MNRPKWPGDFTAITEGVTVHQMIALRDTPPGMGAPRCTVCGLGQGRVVHVHHLLFKSRGGDGRPSNGIVVCPDGYGESCHASRIHGDSAAAAAQGWARSRHAPVPRVYRMPLLCSWRGWVVLRDSPPWWRAATEADMRGDYGDG